MTASAVVAVEINSAECRTSTSMLLGLTYRNRRKHFFVASSLIGRAVISQLCVVNVLKILSLNSVPTSACSALHVAGELLFLTPGGGRRQKGRERVINIKFTCRARVRWGGNKKNRPISGGCCAGCRQTDVSSCDMTLPSGRSPCTHTDEHTDVIIAGVRGSTIRRAFTRQLLIALTMGC